MISEKILARDMKKAFELSLQFMAYIFAPCKGADRQQREVTEVSLFFPVNSV